MKTKQCSKCKKIYPATTEYFHSNISREDNLHLWCKECVNDYEAKRRLKKKKKKGFLIKCFACGKSIEVFSKKQKYCSKECRINVNHRKYFKYLIPFESFKIEECFLNKDVSIRVDNLLNRFNIYLKKYELKKINIQLFNIILKKNNIKIKKRTSYTNLCFGITLKSKIISKAKDLDREEINSKKACKILSCSPTVQFLQEIINKNNIHLNQKKSREVIRKIEKILFKKNIYRSPKNKVACVLYLLTPFTQEEICKMTEIAIQTLRKTMTLFSKELDLTRSKISSLKKDNI